jgi:hypothetical protein
MMYRISRVILSISSLLLIAGCASEEVDNQVTGPITQVYEASYEEVWQALQKTMASYPIKLNNSDTGQIETDTIRPEKMWQPVHKKKDPSPGLRYTIKAATIKGVKGKDKEAVRLTIEKVVTLERDFFAGAEHVPSDGLEEESIFYRVQREITLQRSLKSAFDQGKL